MLTTWWLKLTNLLINIVGSLIGFSILPPVNPSLQVNIEDLSDHIIPSFRCRYVSVYSLESIYNSMHIIYIYIHIYTLTFIHLSRICNLMSANFRFNMMQHITTTRVFSKPVCLKVCIVLINKLSHFSPQNVPNPQTSGSPSFSSSSSLDSVFKHLNVRQEDATVLPQPKEFDTLDDDDDLDDEDSYEDEEDDTTAHNDVLADNMNWVSLNKLSHYSNLVTYTILLDILFDHPFLFYSHFKNSLHHYHSLELI